MPKKKTFTKPFFIILALIIIIAACIIAVKAIQAGNEIKLEEITLEDAKYFTLIVDKKYGVIDAEGNVVIEPQYADLSIPNPTKAVFVATTKTGSDYKAVNESNTEILTGMQSVEAIKINPITSLVPFEKTVLKYKENNLYGIMDFEGNKILKAEYEEIKALEFKEGYLMVKQNGNYGIVNIKGNTILKPEYENIYADGYYNDSSKYSKAGFIVRIKTDQGYRYGYANSNGKTLLDAQYNEINRITEISDDNNAYLITSQNGKYGLMKNDKQILNNEYASIGYDNDNDLLVVTKGTAQETKAGVVNKEGKNVIPVDYDEIFIGGDYINARKGDQSIIFDSHGNQLTTNFMSHIKANDNYAVVIDKNNTYNIVDKDGNKLLKQTYLYIEYFTSNLFIATMDSATGIIDTTENVVVPFEYSMIQKLEDTNILYGVKANSMIDIINQAGKVTSGIKNAKIEVEKTHVKLVSGTEMKYFTLEGKETTYQELFPGRDVFAYTENGKWGLKDKNGQVVVKAQFDMITEQSGNAVGIKVGNKWGAIDLKGNIILEPKYEINWLGPKFLNKYYKIDNGNTLPVYVG